MPSERVLPAGQRADHVGAAERRLCRPLRRALGGAGYPGLVLRLPVGLRPDADGRAAAALHDQVPRAGNRPDLQVCIPRSHVCSQRNLSVCSRRSLDGIPCSSDLGLGSTWEANLRMPAFARWPGRIAAGSVSMEMVSTLDIFATVSPAHGFAEGQRPTAERCDYRAWHWRACRCRRTA